MTIHRPASIRIAIILAQCLMLTGCGDSDDDTGGSTAGTPSNPPLTISGAPPVSIQPGEIYSFTPTVGGVNGQVLSFSIANRPAWATFDTGTGELLGAPVYGDIGRYEGIAITAHNGDRTAALTPFTIEVALSGNGANSEEETDQEDAPGDDQQAGDDELNEGDDVVDTGGSGSDSGSGSGSGGGGWFNWGGGFGGGSDGGTGGGDSSGGGSSDGEGDGSPSDGSGGSDDSGDEAPSDDDGDNDNGGGDEQPPQNNPPTISGTPIGTVMQDQTYVFMPTANDPDGDQLTFTIVNRPAWANFNTTTGRLSGTPGAGDVGQYSGIVISVSDGEATTSLPAFSIEVVAVATGTATLSWQAPTEREDGTPLNGDLAGYRVYWGTSANDLTNSSTIANAGITTYLVEGLTPATWYFAITAFDTAGLESTRSNTASKTIE